MRQQLADDNVWLQVISGLHTNADKTDLIWEYGANMLQHATIEHQTVGPAKNIAEIKSIKSENQFHVTKDTEKTRN